MQGREQAGVARGVFRFPATSTVAYGPQSFERLPELVARHGASRVFAIVSSSLPDVRERLESLLGGALAGAFSGVLMHVPRESVLDAAAAARAADADLVLSIGGGTPIDCAKAVALCLAYDIADRDRFDDFHVRFTYPDKLEVPEVDRDLIPHVAVPTTLSGAESTNLFGVTDVRRRLKHAFSSPKFVVDEIVFDPEFAAGTPAWLWAASGMRAVDHAVEAVLSSRHMPMVDALSLEGLRIVRERLVHAAGNPDDAAARMDCQLGAWLCIYGLTNVGVGLSHGIGHQLAAQFHMLHGVTSACMLPHVMAFNAGHTAPRMRRIAEALGVDVRAMTDGEAADAAVESMNAFVRSLEPLGVPHTLSAAGGTREGLGQVADHAMRDMSVSVNPRPITSQDLMGILEAAWED